MATNLSEKLGAVSQQIVALSKTIGEIAATVGKIERAATSVKPPKAAPKKAPKASAPKKAAKAKPAAPADPSKASDKRSLADTLLGLIQNAENGLSSNELITASGYDKRQVSNALYKLKKQGKVTSPKRGQYFKA